MAYKKYTYHGLCVLNRSVVHAILDYSEALFGPKVVFVLGGPGAGKGTQCAKIAERFFLYFSCFLKGKARYWSRNIGEKGFERQVYGSRRPLATSTSVRETCYERHFGLQCGFRAAFGAGEEARGLGIR